MSDAFSFEASVYWSTSTAGGPVFVHMFDDSIKIEAAKAKPKISRVFGLLKRDGQPPVSIEDMNAAIADGWSDKA